MMMIFSMNTNYNKQSNSDIFWLYKLISWQNEKLRFSLAKKEKTVHNDQKTRQRLTVCRMKEAERMMLITLSDLNE